MEGFITSSLPVRPTTELRKGDDVIALGYPLVSIQGQEQKATFGRVNALSGATGDDRFLQIDAPIQPGNSGGPLLDAHGNVIGIVTATLNQLETFRAAGVVPQNVNYALRTSFLFDLLGDGGGSGLAPSSAIRADTPSREHRRPFGSLGVSGHRAVRGPLTPPSDGSLEPGKPSRIRSEKSGA